MPKQSFIEKPILEGYILGVSCIIIAVIWSWAGWNESKGIFRWIIFCMFLIGTFYFFLAVFWQFTQREDIWEWLLEKPVRFFCLVFGTVSILITFLDIIWLDLFNSNSENFLDNRNNILVEAHGLVFDLLLLGVVLSIYEQARIKREERKMRIIKYLEELENYRGMTNETAAYSVANLVRRLKREGLKDIDYSLLHLGRCSKEIIEEVVRKKYIPASLENLNLAEANLEAAELPKANLKEANLRHTNLKKAFLIGANLQEANLQEVNLQEAELSEVNLQKANLLKANLQKARLWRANLQKTNLRYANLREATLSGTDLKEADLTMANLQETRFWKANLQQANLSNANLIGADLSGANLQQANLSNANLIGADIRNVNLKGAYLDSVKIREQEWIEKLSEWEVQGLKEIEKDYHVGAIEHKDHNGVPYFLLEYIGFPF